MSFKIEHLTFHTVDDLPQGSDKWLLFRRNKITASNAYKLVLKGKNAAMLANRTVGFNNEYSDRGHALEYEIKERLNAMLAKDGYVIREFGSLENDQYPDCAYSPDGVVFPTSLKKLGWEDWRKMPLVEVKCYSDETHHADGSVSRPMKHSKCCESYDNVPIAAKFQMQFGMMIAERDLCYLVLYNPDCDKPENRVKIYPVQRDEKIIERIKEALNK